MIYTRKYAVLLTIVFGCLLQAPATGAPVLLFKSDGTDPSAFNDLSTIGAVHFNTPFAKVFGRDTSLAPLPSGQRFDNDFFGTAADAAFLSGPSAAHATTGIVFASGNFANSGFPAVQNVFSGLNWKVAVPTGVANRRVHVQFGEGQLAGGPAAIGGGNPANKPGRQGAIRVPTNIPGVKIWGQWVNSQRFPIDPNNPQPGIDNAIEQTVQEAARRASITNRSDPRLDLYRGLFDNTQVVDPIESFYIDLANDSGSSFDLELEVLFTNDLFTSLAQFLNFITVEIGVLSDFPVVFDDIINNAYLGTTPFVLDLNAPGGGAGGIPLIQINGSDLVQVPEPGSFPLVVLAMIGIVFTAKTRSQKILQVHGTQSN